MLRKRFSHTDAAQLPRDVAAVFDLADHLSTTPFSCPTCSIENLAHLPPFSVRIHAPLKADIALTYGCNNSCRHCYNEHNRATMPPLSMKEWHRVLDKTARLGIPHVIFTGGEPTLVDGLSELIVHAGRIGQVTGLNTNGRRLSDPMYAARLAKAGLSHIQVTIGSCRAAVHNALTAADAFDETVTGIRRCLETGLHTITNTTLTRQNVDHVEDIVSFLHDLGLRTIALNGMIYSGKGRRSTGAIPENQMGPVLVRARDRARELGMRLLWYTPTAYCRLSPMELDLEPRRCNAAEYSICIEPNGDVLPCQSYYTAAGNMLRDPWDGIWNSPLFRSFRERVDNPVGCGLPEECAHCPDLTLCAGGCRIEREKHLKADPSRLDRVCVTA
jgi:radical SAM protein with 4Fe4S-binding SPASM domain